MKKLMSTYVLLAFLLSGSLSVLAETERETIQKCLFDLKSPDVKKRRRAVLILCKYQRSDVFMQLIPSLSDKDAKVRESVVVGFIESRLSLRHAASPILERLLDENVHVRRMVSSTLLPRLMFYLPDHTRRPIEVLRKALHDEDAIVRKNMINNFFSLRRSLEPEEFYHFLGDASAEIRFIALSKLPSDLPYNVFEPYLQKLVVDKESKIRMKVLKTLGSFGAKGRKYLKIMAKDPEPAIAARAMAYSRNVDYLDKLCEIIMDDSTSSDLIVDLTMTIVTWGDESKKFVYKLLDDADETRRYAALNALVRMSFDIDQKKLLKLIKDDSARTRRLACSLLNTDKLVAGIVSELALSDYPDVREYALRVAVKYSRRNEAMMDALYDLMLDEELSIRTKALQGIWYAGSPDRYDIFSQSLTDSESDIRDMAARLLLSSDDPKAIQIIKDFKQNNKDVNIKHLQNLNQIAVLKKIAKQKQLGWQKAVIKALNSDSLDSKKAAVDITISTSEPELIEALRGYLDKGDDPDLADYLYKRIAEEE